MRFSTRKSYLRFPRCGPSRRKVLVHFRLCPVLAHFFEPESMDPRILVLVLDLVAALLDACRDRALDARCGRARRAPLRRGERVPQAANAGRQIAGGTAAGVEMLVELAIGRGNDDTMLPVNADEILVAFEPQQRIAGTDHAHHMIA